MLQTVKRLERARLWLGLLLVLSFAASLLFFPGFSPRWALVFFLVFWGVCAITLRLIANKILGGRQLRSLSMKAYELLDATLHIPHKKISSEDLLEIKDQKIRLQEALQSKDAPAIQAALTKLEESLSRFTPGTWQSMRELIVLIVFAFLLAVTLKIFIVEPFHIPSASMFPTLHVGDHIFVNKFIFGLRVPFTNSQIFSGWRSPKRGEVIVFAHDEATDYIKRVVAIPGDVVDVTADEITLNGTRLAHEYLGAFAWQELDEMTNAIEERHSNRFIETNGDQSYEVLYDDPPYIMPSRHFVVPPGEYMVLGDNRDHSFDSLDWGFVPLEKIQGRAMFVLGSMNRGSFDWARIGVAIW
jgi:signal peptidase I